MTERENGIPAGRVARMPFLAGLLLLVAVYGIQAGNGFIYDDHLLIGSQAPLDSAAEVLDLFSGTHYTGQFYYRPLTKVLYALEKRWFGASPGPYHAVNVLFIGLTFILFGSLLRRLDPRTPPSRAAFFSLLLCLHPVASSIVYPIAGLETLLVTVLGLSCLLFYLRGDLRGYVASLFLLVLALLSKEQSVVLPAVLILADVTAVAGAAGGVDRGRRLVRWVPLLSITAGYVAVRLLVFGGRELALAPEAHRSASLLSFLYALQTIFAPFARLRYEPTVGVWFSLPRALTALAATALLVAALSRHWAALGRRALFWSGFFLISVLPTANLARQETPYAERYVFLSLLAVTGLLAALAAEGAAGTGGRRRSAAAGMLLLALLGAVTIHRGEYYRDDLSFSTQWMRTNPAHPSARLLYGNALIGLDRHEEALLHLEESVRASPGHAQLRNSLGVLYAAGGRVDEARTMFTEALTIYPEYAEGRFNLAMLEYLNGDRAIARRELERAVALQPNYAEARYRLGVLLAEEGDLQGAREEWERVLRIDPRHRGARAGLEKAGP